MRGLYYLPMYTDIRNHIVERCVNVFESGKKFIYILPSREAMFDVRNRVAKRYGRSISQYIFGFDDLERAIVKDSMPDSNTIGEQASILILKNILNTLNEDNELVLFNRVSNKPGFIEALYSTIKRLKRLYMSPDILNKTIERFYRNLSSEILHRKLIEILEVFYLYESYKKDRGIYDIDDISFIAVEKAGTASIFKGVDMFVVDGFINIDPVNKELMKQVVKHYSNIEFITNVPFKNSIVDEFVLGEIVKDFIELGYKEDKDYLGFYADIEENLATVGKNLFSQAEEIIEGAKNIRVLNAPNIENEVRQAARLIKQKIIDDESKAQGIALYVNNIELYQDPIFKVFKEYGIPIRLQQTQPLLSQPLVRDVLSIIDKEVQLTDAGLIKNLVLSKYLIPLYMQDMDAELKSLDEKVKHFREGAAHRDRVTNHIELVLGLIKELDISNNIISLYRDKIIDSEVFIRDTKVLAKLTSTLQGMKQMYINCELDEGEFDFEHFLNSFLQIYSGETIDMVMQNIEGVKVISPDLARGQYYDYVFILGINEGVFPAAADNSIFDNFENDTLYENGINIYNYRWELQREKIRFNLACTSARKELYLSFRTSDEDGSFIIKSSFLEDFEQLFTKVSFNNITSDRVYMRDRFKYEEKDVMSESEVKEAVISALWQSQDKNLDKLKRFIPIIRSEQASQEFKYINDAGRMEYSRFATSAYSEYDGLIGNTPTKQALDNYSFSASQINSYAGCRIRYYFERVLELGAFDEEELNPKNEGTLYHAVLQEYYKNNPAIESFDENRLKNIVEKNLAGLKNTKLIATVFEARKSEIYNILREFLIQDIEYINEYYKKTGMHIKPVYLEQFFKEAGVFKGDSFKGFIDRIDLEVNKEEKYTKKFIMYDYKRRFIKDFRTCATGGDFQLAIYYHAIMNKLQHDYGIKNPKCMALFYYSIEGLKRDGFVRSEYKKFLFSGNKGPKTTISPLNFETLMNWLKGRVENMVESIKDGDFTPPYQCPSERFGCEFESICRFDKYRMAVKKRD